MTFRNHIWLLAMFLVHWLPAQEIPQAWMEKIYELAESEEEADQMLLEIDLLLRKPIDLNHCEREDLLRIPGMLPVRAEAILEYRALSGPFQSSLELQLIEGIEHDEFYLYKQVVTCESFSGSGPEGRHRGEYLLFFQPSVQKRKGYETGHYPGIPLRQWHRIQYRYSRRLRLGLGLEQDAGEQFRFTGDQAGFDFLTAFMEYKWGNKTLLLGDYRVNRGQGLVLGNGGGFGASVFVTRIFRPESEQVSRSAEENLLMRGALLKRKNNRFEQTLFGFAKRVDGKTDSEGIGFTSGGLHRTESELLKRRQLWRSGLGYSLLYRGGNGSISFQGLWLREENQTGYFGGVAHRHRIGNSYVFGELAVDGQRNLSFVEGLVYSPHKQLDLSAQVRIYPPQQGNPFAGGFSAFSIPENERGLFLSAEYRSGNGRYWKCFADQAFRPTPSFRVSEPYWRRQWFLETGRRVQGVEFSQRLQWTRGIRDFRNPEWKWTPTLEWTKIQIRFQAGYASEPWNLRWRLEICRFAQAGQQTGSFLFYQDIHWKPKLKKYYLLFRYTCFRVPAYDARIYAYESDVLYAYSVPAFSGTGQRVYLVGRVQVWKSVDLWLKAGVTWYSDREVISSGADQINSSRVFDTRLMLRGLF